jgi:hypothetical protein
MGLQILRSALSLELAVGKTQEILIDGAVGFSGC